MTIIRAINVKTKTLCDDEILLEQMNFTPKLCSFDKYKNKSVYTAHRLLYVSAKVS